MAGKPGLDFGNYSGVGRVREKNEDYFGSFLLAKGHLFVVCDGMGGHKGGQRASQLAVETIRQYVESTVELEPTVFLRRAVEKANEAVFIESRLNEGLQGMGTTCVIMLVRPGPKPEGWIAHVGDSRMYRLRRGKITRLTKDHSKVQKMVDMGILSQKEAAEHPQKNVITKAIGIEQNVYPDVKQIDIFRNDRYILCTDGVTDLLTDSDLELFAEREKEPQRLAESIVSLSDERGGYDNATIQVIDIRKGPPPPKEGKEGGIPRPALFVLLSLIAILTLVLFSKTFCGGGSEESPTETEVVQPDTSDASFEVEEAVEPLSGEQVIQSNEGALPVEPADSIPSLRDSVEQGSDTSSLTGGGSTELPGLLGEGIPLNEETGSPDTL